jgi:hypothetical protein
MIARGFKPVGWVAAVGTAALGCYMLSLQVASERAELAGLERQIVSTQQDIRSLQTELGTRGRLQQLEQWNAEVLSLSAPVAGQYLENNVSLARFDTRQPDLSDQAEVRMASADAAPAPAPVAAPVMQVAAAVPPRAAVTPRLIQASATGQQATVRRAGLMTADAGAAIGARPDMRNLAATTPAPRRTATVAAETAPRPAAATIAAPPRNRVAPVRTAANGGETVRSRTPARAATEGNRRRPSAAASLLDDRTVRELGSTSRSERQGGTR